MKKEDLKLIQGGRKKIEDDLLKELFAPRANNEALLSELKSRLAPKSALTLVKSPRG
jgi:hypothetical protein